MMGIYTDKRKMTVTPDGYELLTHESGHLEYDFGWHLGPYWSRFIAEMRDNRRFMGTKCPECGSVYIPPRVACGRCYKEMNEWVEVGPGGVLEAFTIVRFPYIDCNNGELRKVPFTAVSVALDGANTRFWHLCDEVDEKKLMVGMRVRPVWADEPRPTSIHAVRYFEIVTGKKAAGKGKAPAGKRSAAKPAAGPAERPPAKKKAAVKKPSKKKSAAKKPVKRAAAKKKSPAGRPARKRTAGKARSRK